MPHIVGEAHGGGDLARLGLTDGAATGCFDEGDAFVGIRCHNQRGGWIDTDLYLGCGIVGRVPFDGLKAR